MTNIRLLLPRRLEWQERCVQWHKRFNVLSIGRRAGKTILGIDRIAHAAVKGNRVAWFGPTYKMLADAWRQIRHIMQPLTKRASDMEHRIELVTNGVIDGWSLDKPDAARGRKYHEIVVDEAAMIGKLEEAWLGAIRPTLADYEGKAWFMSTPKGHNYFWRLWQQGRSKDHPEWKSWQLPTGVNPGISEEEIEAARLSLPQRWFEQEYLAEFVDDAGGVFRGVLAAATADVQTEAAEGHKYLIGCDWGKSGDFTVFAVADLNERAIVHIDRGNKVDYVIQSGRLKALAEKFRPIKIIAERNSMGEPIIERLQRDGLPVEPFLTTNASKAQIIDGLALAFERDDIRIINHPDLVAELQAFERTPLPSGQSRYAAPSGMHDDCVMAAALAWSGVTTPTPWYLREIPAQTG